MKKILICSVLSCAAFAKHIISPITFGVYNFSPSQTLTVLNSTCSPQVDEILPYSAIIITCDPNTQLTVYYVDQATSSPYSSFEFNHFLMPSTESGYDYTYWMKNSCFSENHCLKTDFYKFGDSSTFEFNLGVDKTATDNKEYPESMDLLEENSYYLYFNTDESK